MKKKRILWSIALILVCFLLIVVFIRPKEKVKDDILIGAILPLTGTAAEFGIGNKNGFDLAVNEVNQHGGINGRKVKIIYEDSKNEPKTALSAFQRMKVTTKLDALFTCMSSVSLALKPLVKTDPILTFSVAAAPKLTDSVDFIYRLLPTTAIQAEILSQLMVEQLKKSTKSIQSIELENERIQIVLFYLNDDFGLSFASSFKKKVIDNKDVSLNISSFDGNQNDFKNDIVKNISINTTSGVAVGGYGSSLGILIKQLREFGYKGPIYGTPDMGYPNILDLVKENLGEAYIVDFDIDKNNPNVKKFIEEYKTIHSQDPSMDAYIGYDGLHIFLKAFELLSYDKSESLIEAIKTIDSINGVTGNIKILESGDIIFPLTLKKL